MTILTVIFSMLAAASTQLAPPPTKAQQQAEAEVCPGPAMSIYLPGKEGTPAPNISLVQFQYMSHEDPCGRNISNDELMRLHVAIKAITAKAFSTSKKNFWVMVKYTLTQNSPATLEMKASIPQTGNEELGFFYDKAASLVSYHSTSGTVEVLFHYKISPSSAKSSAPRGTTGG